MITVRKNKYKYKGEMRESKRWYYQFHFEGKRFFHVGSIDKKTTERMGIKCLRELEEHGLGKRKSVPVPEGLKMFLRHSEIHKRSFKTDVGRAKHLEAFFREKKLDKLTPDNVNQYITHRKGGASATRP